MSLLFALAEFLRCFNGSTVPDPANHGAHEAASWPWKSIRTPRAIRVPHPRPSTDSLRGRCANAKIAHSDLCAPMCPGIRWPGNTRDGKLERRSNPAPGTCVRATWVAAKTVPAHHAGKSRPFEVPITSTNRDSEKMSPEPGRRLTATVPSWSSSSATSLMT